MYMYTTTTHTRTCTSTHFLRSSPNPQQPTVNSLHRDHEHTVTTDESKVVDMYSAAFGAAIHSGSPPPMSRATILQKSQPHKDVALHTN